MCTNQRGKCSNHIRYSQLFPEGNNEKKEFLKKSQTLCGIIQCLFFDTAQKQLCLSSLCHMKVILQIKLANDKLQQGNGREICMDSPRGKRVFVWDSIHPTVTKESKNKFR